MTAAGLDLDVTGGSTSENLLKGSKTRMMPTRTRPAFSSVQNVSLRKIMEGNGADDIIEEVPQSSNSLKTEEASKSNSEDSISLESASENLHNSKADLSGKKEDE